MPEPVPLRPYADGHFEQVFQGQLDRFPSDQGPGTIAGQLAPIDHPQVEGFHIGHVDFFIPRVGGERCMDSQRRRTGIAKQGLVEVALFPDDFYLAEQNLKL